MRQRHQYSVSWIGIVLALLALCLLGFVVITASETHMGNGRDWRLQNIQDLASVLDAYANKHGGNYPVLRNTSDVRKALSMTATRIHGPGGADVFYMTESEDKYHIEPYVPNPYISGKAKRTLPSMDIVAFYEPHERENVRAVVLLSGVVHYLNTDEWSRVKSDLSKPVPPRLGCTGPWELCSSHVVRSAT